MNDEWISESINMLEQIVRIYKYIIIEKKKIIYVGLGNVIEN